ncbi:hypothetical protein [Rhodopseudomonas sp. B29]|uniref:hypothetical protein n=1 Tax=Rhodopseudomonas sp. B29 TaxID=95607 RepID=UPI0003B3789A|nr:hypothetical protein [Rhodopseudomonas sp. B29]
METTEKIVEAYVRHVKRWATIPNIRCDAQQEIDLLAINPVTLERYHIETSVSGSQVYSKLTNKEFDPALLKLRVQKPKMRRTLGYFISHKFGTKAILDKLSEYGFKDGAYKKVVVTWDWTPDAKATADAQNIELWDFRMLMRDIATSIQHSRGYFTDDTLRTINLFMRALVDAETPPNTETSIPRRSKATCNGSREQDLAAPYWVYRNWIRGRARLHMANCSYCNNGSGTQGSLNSVTGEWKSFKSETEAKVFLDSFDYDDAKLCGACMTSRTRT